MTAIDFRSEEVCGASSWVLREYGQLLAVLSDFFQISFQVSLRGRALLPGFSGNWSVMETVISLGSCLLVFYYYCVCEMHFLISSCDRVLCRWIRWRIGIQEFCTFSTWWLSLLAKRHLIDENLCEGLRSWERPASRAGKKLSDNLTWILSLDMRETSCIFVGEWEPPVRASDFHFTLSAIFIPSILKRANVLFISV